MRCARDGPVARQVRSPVGEDVSKTIPRESDPRRQPTLLWVPMASIALTVAATYFGCFLPDFDKVPGEDAASGQPSGPGPGPGPGGGPAGPGGGGAGGQGGSGADGGSGATGGSTAGSGGVPTEGCVAPPTNPADACTGAMGSLMVRVPAEDGSVYCVDVTEVTNAQYATFLAAMPNPMTQEAFCTWNTD